MPSPPIPPPIPPTFVSLLIADDELLLSTTGSKTIDDGVNGNGSAVFVFNMNMDETEHRSRSDVNNAITNMVCLFIATCLCTFFLSRFLIR